MTLQFSHPLLRGRGWGEGLNDMKKRKYIEPLTDAVQLRHPCRLCSGSDWDVLEPDEPNLPAGTREYAEDGLWDQ